MKECLLAKIKIQMHTYLSPPLLYDGPLVPLPHTGLQICRLVCTLVLIHLLNLLRAGSKRHTPAHRLSWRAKPREGVMFTLHHY